MSMCLYIKKGVSEKCADAVIIVEDSKFWKKEDQFKGKIFEEWQCVGKFLLSWGEWDKNKV